MAKISPTSIKYSIVADFSHLSIFDEDFKEKGIAMRNYIAALDIAFNSGALTIEQYKEEITKVLWI